MNRIVTINGVRVTETDAIEAVNLLRRFVASGKLNRSEVEPVVLEAVALGLPVEPLDGQEGAH